MRRHLSLLLALLLLAAFAAVLPAVQASPLPAPTGGYQVFLPAVVAPPPLPPVSWDPRLDQRGTFIITADVQPGQGYWRLVTGVWYAVGEPPFDGQHNIFIDTLDAAGQRQAGVPINISNLDGSRLFATVGTELKPGEPYATNFPMYALAPAYRAVPDDGNPADAVSGMGMGSIEKPWEADHTSYGFVWQWTVAPGGPTTTQISVTD